MHLLIRYSKSLLMQNALAHLVSTYNAGGWVIVLGIGC